MCSYLKIAKNYDSILPHLLDLEKNDNAHSAYMSKNFQLIFPTMHKRSETIWYAFNLALNSKLYFT